MIRLISFWIAVLGAFAALGSGTLTASNVKVDEVTISLYNKPVTGFRVVLDRSQSVVSSKIIDHISQSESAKPFEYERTIIYENIRYAPITEERDISLYFLLRNLQGQFTELTYVVMYDYKRSVSTRNFPRLSLLLKIDLARLVRGISGEVMESDDIVFDDATLQQLSNSEEDVAGSAESDPGLEHFQEEEVENASVLIREDPFNAEGGVSGTAPVAVTMRETQSGDTTIVRLQKRIQELEERERQLVASQNMLQAEQDIMARKQDLMMVKVKENKSLRDSIVLLNKRVEGMLGQYYVSDDISVSNETAERIFELERLKERNELQIDILTRENDSLSRIAGNMRRQLASLSDSQRSQSEKLLKLEKDNEALSADLTTYRARNLELEQAGKGRSGVDSLLNLLSLTRERSREMETQLANDDQETTRLKEENDWLVGKKLQLEERLTDLESENRGLHNQLDATVPGKVIIPDNPGQDSLTTLLNTSLRENASLEKQLTAARSEENRLKRQTKELTAEKDRLDSRVASLESEIESMRLNGGGVGSRDESTLRDTLRLMKQRMRNLQGQEAENAELRKQVASQKADLATRSAEVKDLNSKLNLKSDQLSKSESQTANLKKQLSASKRNIESAGQSLRQSQAEVERLNEEKQALNKRISDMRSMSGQSDTKVQTLLDSIDLVHRQKVNLQQDISNRDRRIRTQIERSDSLQNLIAQGENQRNDLRRQLSQLETRIDSLSRTALPQNDQAQFMREQWSKLQQWEKELNARDKTISDNEKLLTQRKSFVDKKEKDLADRESQMKDLKDREEALRLREQELNSREGSSGLNIRTDQIAVNPVNEFGTAVTVFQVETPLRYQLAQKQVVAYMLSRNEILDEQFPDILYRSVMLPELDLQPLEFRVRIASEGTGTVIKFSFKLADGSYLGDGSSRKITEKAKQLISNLLRYTYQG